MATAVALRLQRIGCAAAVEAITGDEEWPSNM
jgi:hypothetical protein